MVDHPLIPEEVKSYMQRHNIESTLNKSLNAVLKTLPQDPLSVMAAVLIDVRYIIFKSQQSVVNLPVLERLEAKETIICDTQKTIKIIVHLQFQGKIRPYYTYVMPFNQEDTTSFSYDKQEEKLGMKNACKIINEEISPLLKGKEILGLKKLDEMLLSLQKKTLETRGVQIGDNVVKACSEALMYAYGACLTPADPFISFYRYIMDKDYLPGAEIPKLCFTVLNGGKALGSKVRFSKVYLIMDISPQDEIDPVEAYFKIQTQIRKQVTSHKSGENGFKPGPDGSYFNPLENVNETFKFIEDAINATQINNDKQKYLKYGINPDIDSYFVKEQYKYDMEGPKNLFDQDMLTEYFMKMCNEHPLLEYLEDPMADGDVLGYQKILKRFREAQPRVRIGVKNFFKSNIDTIKHYTMIVQKEQDEDDEEAKKKKEEEEKKKHEEAAKEEVKDVPEPVSKGGRDSQAKKAMPDPKNAGNKGSQAKLEPLQFEPVVEDKNEPNKHKFIPHIIHIERSLIKTSYKIWELVMHQHLLKPEEQFQLMIEDCYFENTQGDLIDFAFGSQMGYVNLRGFFKNEKTQKVLRYAEIIDTVRSMLKDSLE